MGRKKETPAYQMAVVDSMMLLFLKDTIESGAFLDPSRERVALRYADMDVDVLMTRDQFITNLYRIMHNRAWIVELSLRARAAASRNYRELDVAIATLTKFANDVAAAVPCG